MKTIEEKAKRYDEIIEKANKMHHENCEACQMCIEELIPELAESDDDIRKALIKYFSEGREYLSLIPYNKEQCVSWLEKQVEPKSIEPDTLIEEAYQQQADDIINMVTEKSSWSEEDEDMHYKVIAVINRLCAEGKEYVWSIKTLKKLFYWLKSLKERVQPHNMWKPSDEQMLAINTAINVLGKGTINGKYLIELHEQLKKL